MDAVAPLDRLAPFRHHQELGGIDPLPDLPITERPDRDGASGPDLQHEANDLDGRHAEADGGAVGLNWTGHF